LLADSGVEFLCVGPNFRCGHKMDTNVAALAGMCGSLGVDTEIVQPVLYQGHPVSSSRIRNAILDGQLKDASAMLGRPYGIRFETMRERADGGFEASAAGEIVLPPPGAYSVQMELVSGTESAIARVSQGLVTVGGKSAAGVKGLVFIDSVSRE